MDTTKPTDTATRDAARKANARAFLKDKPKAGKAWTSKTYVYDKEENDGRES